MLLSRSLWSVWRSAAPAREPRRSPIALAYIALYFSTWPFIRPSLAAAAWGVVATVVISVLWWVGSRRSGDRILPFAFAIALIASALSVFGGAWGVLTSVAAAMTGAVRPRRKALLCLPVLALLVLVTVLVAKRPLFELAAPLIFGFMAWLTATHRTELEAINEALRQAQERGRLLAIQAERDRIARDLHDLFGQTLTTIAIKSDLACRLAPEESAATREMASIGQVARSALSEIRKALAGIRSATVDMALAEARTALSAAAIELRAEVDVAGLPPAQAETFAALLREGVTNVCRHSGARHCRISIYPERGSWTLAIEDDGRGAERPEGMGMAGMRERAAELRGRLDFASDARGTRLAVTLPGDRR